MKRLNKKGFTLIELLAVIVVLAIIMVIATQQVNKTIAKSRANAFVESYQMLVKQVKMFIAEDDDPSCTSSSTCLTKYELSNDYTLTVKKNGSKYDIILTASDSGKFKNINLNSYGSYNVSGKCSTAKIASGATGCTTNSITGSVSY